jgi:uncharacterized repeat protein (TIGR03943 family)
VNREAQNVLLVLVGGTVVRISLDDTFLRYVKEWMRPGLLASGAVLVAIGLVSLWRERPRATSTAKHAVPASAQSGPAPHGQGHDGRGPDGHGHKHAEHAPWVAWLLLLPVLAILLVAPPALGSYAASRSTAAVTEPAQGQYEPLPAGDPVTTTVTDYAVRAIWEDGLALQGRRVRLVGFVTPRPGGGFHLTRIVLVCCAADGRPVSVAVPDPPRAFPVDTWVAVTGTYGGLEPGGSAAEQVPVLRADTVTPVPEPADPYE